MTCTQCNAEATEKVFGTFSYLYCSDCRMEVAKTPTTQWPELIQCLWCEEQGPHECPAFSIQWDYYPFLDTASFHIDPNQLTFNFYSTEEKE